MHQITCGETHKVEIHTSERIDDYLKNEKLLLSSLCEISCLYPGNILIKDVALNYLNAAPKDEYENQIKSLILKEFYDCEKLYPYLGDVFLLKYFEKNIKGHMTFIFSKESENKFLESLVDPHVKQIAKWMFENISLNRNITIDKYHGKDIYVQKINDLVFNVNEINPKLKPLLEQWSRKKLKETWLRKTEPVKITTEQEEKIKTIMKVDYDNGWF